MDHWTASDSLYSDENVMYSNDFSFGGGATDKGKMQLNLESLPKKKSAALLKSNNECTLTTPDLNMLQLASPELERLIIEQHGAITTPTPSGCFLNGDLCKHGTRNDYAQRLATAYDAEKKSLSEAQVVVPLTRTSGISTQHAINSTPMIAVTQSSNTFANNNYAINMLPNSSVKDEKSQIVPVASNALPQIDLEEQEWVKKERKRERNRLAASRCRKRKLEKEKDLQDRVKELKCENNKLTSTVETLRKEICAIKEQILQHVGAGCHISLPQ
ncbi:expressed hypothetical protein [Trichoplax adhaerens]|uniref:BZIP domain-containing protein n=1 Tax=Trichoplax adhaerens TaxID=10228 RepID=B3S0Y3_TRIAD|nr:expressed hypothetical protein [Trichoplax adhaerens]EDV23471.1 expressed hypothetical protein [Trichoplax adhaerens]|eukprot:XP_002114381.1 expressed hypothetical protein [Trichoplax adhaerens]